MNEVKFSDVTIRDCYGSGCISLIDRDTYTRPDITHVDVRFSMTGNGKDYTLTLMADKVMTSTLINSDHVLIMKQILKEMGEI